MSYIFKIKKFDTDGNRTDSLIKGEFAQFDVAGDEDRGRTYVQTALGAKAFAWKSETDQLRTAVSELLQVNTTGGGFTTTETKKSDRWLETNTPNVIVDKKSDDVVFSDGVYSRDTSSSTFTLPEAPFASSNDELLDDKVNGLTTQQAHNKGDIVVIGNELAANGTFDSNATDGFTVLSGYDGFLWDASGKAILQNTTRVFQPGILHSDVGYVMSFDVEGLTGGYFRVFINGVIYKDIYTNGTHTITCDNDGVGSGAYFYGTYGHTGTVLIDNISIRLKDNVYQAKVDTPSTDLTTISDWQVLDNLDGIQDIILVRKHKLTKAIDTYNYRSINNWNETHSNDDIMLGEGFSKVNNINDVYEDNYYEYIFVGFVSKLNAGAYHPVYNARGTKLFAGDSTNSGNIDTYAFWYSDYNQVINFNIYSCFNYKLVGDIAESGKIYTDGRVNTGGFSPDSKIYNKIYLNQLVDRCTYSLPISEEEALRWAKTRELDYAEENGTQNNSLVVEDLTDTAQTIFSLSKKAKQIYEVLKSIDGGVTWTSISFTYSNINNTVAVVASDLIKVSYEAQNKPFQESSSKLTDYIRLNAIATNSYDIKKGAMITFSATDIIPISDTSNNLESEYLSDVVLDEDGNLLTTPKHVEFNLNNTNSSACKYYEYIAEDNSEIFRVVEAKELAYNTNTLSYDGDNELFDGSTTDLNGNNIKNRTLVQRLPIRRMK